MQSKIRTAVSLIHHPRFVAIKNWITRTLGRNTLLFLSFFVGVCGATVAIVVKNLLYYTNYLLSTAFPEAQVNYYYLAFPLVGIILTVIFVKFAVKDNINHGVSIVLNAISNYNGKLRPHNIYSSMVAASVTVGFGGSVGLEAPIVLTGSAVGSNLARLFNLQPKQTILLLACGSSAAMAAIFKAPVASIVFAIEVLMIDLTASTAVPLLISAATGTILSLLFLGEDVMLTNTPVTPFRLYNVWIYIVLGMAAGLVSVYFLRASRLVDRIFSKLKRQWLRLLIGSVLLGGLIFIFPVFYGEGYESIGMLTRGDTVGLFKNSPLFSFMESDFEFFFLFLAGIVLIKVIATAITTASGGVGGVFAPSLFVGAFLGFLLSQMLNHYFGLSLPVTNCVLAGMAGLLAGVMHAPLTGIFLIAELTAGYGLLIPLMVTSPIAYITSRIFEKHSVYTRTLAERGRLKTHNKDKFAVRKIDFMNLLDKNVSTVPLSATLRQFVDVIAGSKRNIFVVLDDNKKFVGLLLMDDHRDVIFKPQLYDSYYVRDLLYVPDVVVFDTDTAEQMVSKFQQTKNFNLPVITRDGNYLGFLSRARVLDVYKDVIAEESDD
ncbi:MAG: chloride channel protein [Bacteroidales bacterium]|nr:chloride channel protein [Bacteroidales bacterium]